MTITIHVLPLIIGFFLGIMIGAGILYFGYQWDFGWREGWECRRKYEEELKEKEKEATHDRN